MKQKLTNVIEWGILISIPLIFILLVIGLGGEPTSWTEEGLYDYYHYYDKGNFGWYFKWTLIWLVVSLIILLFVRFVIFHKNQKKK